MSNKSGRPIAEVNSLVEDLAGQGLSPAEIHRFLTKDTAPNQHDTNPRARKEVDQGNMNFYTKHGR